MSDNSYINIDGGINEKTPWISPGHGVTYNSLGYPEGYQLSYTRIKKEIPTLSEYSGPLTDEQYWKNSPKMQCKLSTHNIFSTNFDYFPSSLIVHLNNSHINNEDITILSNNRFSINPLIPDGFFWVSYVPNDPSLCAGDKRSILNGPKIESEYIAPDIKSEDLTRCRMAINALEIQSNYIPTSWIGGPYNSLRSGPKNIIKYNTQIYTEHIKELQQACYNLTSHFDTLTFLPIEKPVFSDLRNVNPYNVSYIEEIRRVINILEEHLITILS